MKNLCTPYINPCLSVLTKNAKVKAVSINGKIKKLQCDKILFDTILASVDGQASLPDLIATHSQTYSASAIEHFFKILIQAEVLLDKNKTEKSRFLNIESQDSIGHPLVIGRGKIYSAIQDISVNSSLLFFKNNLFWEITQEENIEYDQLAQTFLSKLSENKPELVVACPDKAYQQWLAALNEACLGLSVPLLFAYCDGQNLVIGPTIIPWKSPCYACLLQHRLNFMATNSTLQLDWEEMLKMGEAWPLPAGELVQGAVAWAASLILAEVTKIVQGTICPTYIKRQIKIPLSGHYDIAETTFSTLTSCPACAGMNKAKFIMGRPGNLSPPEHVILDLKDSKAKHNDGGLRNHTAQEARALLTQAMNKLGVAVKVKSLSGPLDTVLPSFGSEIDAFYHKDFPFIIDKKNHWGKGLSQEQAFLSGGFELFERISADYYGDVEMIRASYDEVRDIAIDVKAQIGTVQCDYGLEPFTVDTEIDWIWGYSLTQEKAVLVPAFTVYLNSLLHFKGAFYPNSSGGLAAGTTIEDALLQGLYETVEHDAWMIYQANAINPPTLEINSLPDAQTRSLVKKIEDSGYQVIIKYLQNDFNIHVFKTWILNEKDYVDFAFCGYGANLDPLIAINRSITEAKLGMPNHQPQKNISFPYIKNKNLFSYKKSIFYLHQFLKTEVWAQSSSICFSNIKNMSTGSVISDIKQSIELLQKNIEGSDIIVVNLTREEFNIPVARVIVPGLQNCFEPIQCMKYRLFDMPKKLGFIKERQEYKKLYTGTYPH